MVGLHSKWRNFTKPFLLGFENSFNGGCMYKIIPSHLYNLGQKQLSSQSKQGLDLCIFWYQKKYGLCNLKHEYGAKILKLHLPILTHQTRFIHDISTYRIVLQKPCKMRPCCTQKVVILQQIWPISYIIQQTQIYWPVQ